MVSRPGDLHNFQMEYHGFLSCLEFGIGQCNEMRERERERIGINEKDERG